MTDQRIRTRNVRRVQKRVQIGHNILCGARHRNGVATAEMSVVKDGPRTVIHADMRNGTNTGQYHRRTGFALCAPKIRVVAIAGFENDNGAPDATTFQIQLASANVDEPGKVRLRWRCHWRNSRLHLRPFAARDEREDQCGRHKRFPEKQIEQVYWNFEIMAGAKSKVS